METKEWLVEFNGLPGLLVASQGCLMFTPENGTKPTPFPMLKWAAARLFVKKQENKVRLELSTETIEFTFKNEEHTASFVQLQHWVINNRHVVRRQIRERRKELLHQEQLCHKAALACSPPVQQLHLVLRLTAV